jgi:hypothetical protein
MVQRFGMELLSTAVVGLMAGAAALWRVPVRECDRCPHCLAERQEEARRREDERHRQLHAVYGTHCPICQRDA